MREIKNRIAKVLSNYFNNNDVDLSSSDIERMSTEIQYASHAKLDDAGVVYHIINITGEVDNVEGNADKFVSREKTLTDTENKILFIVGSIGDKLKASEPKYIKAFNQYISEKLKIKSIAKCITEVSVDFVSGYNKEFEISISNRVDRLSYQMPDKSEEKALGHVYVASLADIVNLYDKIGDSLFDLNVRYSIKDILRVEEEIKSTLIENPEKFWFFNNGITLIVEEKSYKSNKPYSISLKNSAGFSVINGAQTITTASKCFAKNAHLMEKFRTAKVLLRIIVVDKIKSPFAKDVSLSLNRQKSITQVDIATSFDFVKSLNELMLECEDYNICFELSKRGGTPTYKYHYYIDEFAQLVEAYFNQKPGSARRNKNALISIAPDEQKKPKLVRNNIFWELQSAADIKKYYAPVNYSYELIESYRKHPNLYSEDEIQYAILSYGRFYFVAATVFCLNNKDTTDFSTFVFPEKINTDELIDKFVRCFSDFLACNKIESLDSNDFKTETLYEKFKESTNMEDYYQYICDTK